MTPKSQLDCPPGSQPREASRVLAAVSFWQETNTFNSFIFGEVEFESGHVCWSQHDDEDDLTDSEAGALAGVRSLEPDVELHHVCNVSGPIGGRVSSEFAGAFLDRVVGELRQIPRVDGVVLLLHGACSSQSDDDLDGRIATCIRNEVGPQVPIVLGLDHHANITEQMVAAVDAIIGHRTEPHNPYETAFLSTQLAGTLARSGAHVRMAWCKLPMIVHQEHFETATGPMADVFDLARRIEQEHGVVAVSPFPMQPWLDVQEAGWTVVCVTDESTDPLPGCCELATAVWDRRFDFLAKSSLAVSDAVVAAINHRSGRVVLHDMGDSVMAGAEGTSSALLVALLGKGRTVLGSVVAPGIVDDAYELPTPPSVSLASIGLPPGRVVGTHDGSVDVRGLVGMDTIDEGRTVLVECENLLIHATTRSGVGGAHPNVFRKYDIDCPADAVFIVKMSADYGCFDAPNLLRIRVDTQGCSQSDLASLSWTNVDRPIFGLDDDVSFDADQCAIERSSCR